MSEKRGAPAGSDGFCEAMRAAIDERWRTVWATLPASIAGEDIEAVHDTRVASRRLRAAMDAGAPCFPGRWYRPLHAAARDLTSALGAVRDRDVLLQAFGAERDAAPAAEAPGIDRLIGRLERERVTARAEMEAHLEAMLAGPLPAETARRFGAPDTERPSGPARKRGAS